MNLIDITEWYNDIRIEAPAAPNPMIADKVRLAAIEVCKRTMVSRETLDLIDIEAGVKQYKIEPPSSCLKIWRVLWMKTMNGTSPLRPQARHNLISLGYDWERQAADAATDWIQIKNDIVQLWPAPAKDLDEELQAHVAFIPDPRTPKLDDRLYFYYKEAIVAGALAKLLVVLGLGYFKTEPEQSQVGFHFELHAPGAGRVELLGTFNNWQTDDIVLVGPDASGHWTAKVELPEGRHEYIFLVDGDRWLADPKAATHRPDGFGRVNTVINIYDEDSA